MTSLQVYTAISMITLATVAYLEIFVRRGTADSRITLLAGLAVACVIAASLFSDKPLIGYSLMGLGIIFTALDYYRRRQKS